MTFDRTMLKQQRISENQNLIRLFHKRFTNCEYKKKKEQRKKKEEKNK